MNGQTPHLKPIYQKTTTTLNEGVNVTAPLLSPVTGYYVYATTAGGTTLYRQTAAPIPQANADLISGPIVTNLGGPVATDGAGVAPPEIAPPVTTGGSGSSLTGGTYMVAIAWVTPAGVTTISPVATATITTGQFIQVTAPASNTTYAFGSLATTPVTAILSVPRLEDWHVTRYAIYVSGPNTIVPSINLYLDSISSINLLDTSALGAQNSANADLNLRPGQIMIAVWTAVALGVTCTLSVFGAKLS